MVQFNDPETETAETKIIMRSANSNNSFNDLDTLEHLHYNNNNDNQTVVGMPKMFRHANKMGSNDLPKEEKELNDPY